MWTGDRLQVERVGFISRMVLVDGSVRIGRGFHKNLGASQWILHLVYGVLCYLAGRITSLMELVVNTDFVPCDLKQF